MGFACLMWALRVLYGLCAFFAYMLQSTIMSDADMNDADMSDYE